MSGFNKEMMTLAREMRQCTQARLAEATGIAQGSISKIETGQAEPSDEALESIAEHLSLPVTFFRQELRIQELPPSFFRRKLTKVPQKTVKAARSRWTLLLRGLSVLLEAIEYPEVRLPVMDLEELGIQPSEAAARVRVHWGVPVGPIENVAQLLESKGILVVPFDFGTTRIDGMSVYERSLHLPPVVFVNRLLPGDRQRFTLLHELGHLTMHAHLLGDEANDDIEDEADAFASEFLLPTDQLRGNLTHVTLATLANQKPYWKASIAALIMKADNLGVLSPGHKERLWKAYSRRGYRTGEPNPIRPEEPVLFKRMLDLHRHELGYSDEELATILCHVGQDDLREMYPVEAKPRLRLVPPAVKSIR